MALTRTLACQNCRQWLLKSFISTFNIPQAPPPQRRNFSAPTRRRNEARERIQQAEKDAFALNDINEDINSPQKQSIKAESEDTPSNPPGAEAVETTAEHIPWYLRSTTTADLPSSTTPNDFSARQQIPDLPTNPPPLLAPLLQQISVDLGIDDLVLLDLRSLDPPPALGANLLMIIGTARSEKHLHVSADKLCRWLRSEHFLSPYADGLLGRQELKLKVRRRAKRARLLGAVGGKAEQDDVADGIRTGWVCVNVGEVPAAEGEEEQGERVVEREGSFVGFGPGRRDGCRVVVQMLTEEKRGEVDLEKLWGAVLRKSEREREALLNAEAVEQEVEGVEDGVEGVKAEAEESLAEVVTAVEEGSEQKSNAPFQPLQVQQQVRAYHTSARRLQGTIETSSPENTTLDSISQSAEAQQTQQPPSPEQASEEASEFYKAFTSMPALRLPRTAPLYTALFNHISSGAFNHPSTTRPNTRDDWTMIGNRAEEDPAHAAASETLDHVRGFAESRAVLGETLSAMEVEEPAVDIEGEGGVELGMAIMKAIKFVDPNAVIREFGPWRARCERVLRRALEGYKA